VYIEIVGIVLNTVVQARFEIYYYYIGGTYIATTKAHN